MQNGGMRTALARCSRNRSSRLPAVIAVIAALWGTNASADSDVRLTATTSSVGETAADSSYKYLDLGGFDFFVVKTEADDSMLWIVFNAECTVSGSSTTWFEIDILVDGLVVAPTDGDNAQCTEGPMSTGVEAVVGVGAGVHLIEVRGRIPPSALGSGGRWWIDEKSLVVVVRETVP
jgi:hypothetical protein